MLFVLIPILSSICFPQRPTLDTMDGRKKSDGKKEKSKLLRLDAFIEIFPIVFGLLAISPFDLLRTMPIKRMSLLGLC